MNILLMSDNFLPGIGGMENALFGLANSLSKQGHNVMLVAPHYNKKKEDDSVFNFQIYRKTSLKIDNNNYYAFPIYTKKIDKAITSFKPDIIHCHSQAGMLSLALKIKKRFNIPCVCTMHTKYSACYRNVVKLNCIVNMLCKRIGRKLKKVDQVIAVSYDMKSEFEKYGYNGEFLVIKNGLTLNKFPIDDDIKNLSIEKFNLNPDENCLLFVGHISKVKNLDFTLDSLEILNKTFPDFKMFLVGSGENEKYFKNKVENMEIKDKVFFTGKITDKKLLSSIYYNSKILVFPSIFDNDSLCIIESAIYNTPSITIEKTGSSERITNNVNGFIVKNDTKEMAKRLEEILSNPAELQKVSIKAGIDLPKTWEQASQEYLKVYNDIIKNKKRLS